MGKKIKIKKIKPIVTYVGSMLQQNHGELLENHGYLIWDVKSRTFEEYDIKNDYGFLTIDVVKGVIPQWVYDEIGVKLPKRPRLRVRFNDTEPSAMQLCITELQKLFNVRELTVTRTDTLSSLKLNNELNANIVGDVADVSFQTQLIRDYLERQFLLEPAELDKIAIINTDTNAMVTTGSGASNIIWKPIKFEFSNMFSYGENNKVDFDKANGIIGIFAANSSGKSSIWDALSFCIFDKTARSSTSKKILNTRKEDFYCKFEFEIDGIIYFIERTAKWTRKKTNLKVNVNFWKEVGGVPESLNGEQRRETNNEIEKYLGTFDDFILTTLSLQGNHALFIDKKQTERKEILSQFIGVDIFDRLYQIAVDENRDNAAVIKKFKADEFNSSLAKIEISLSETNIQYTKCDSELSKVTTITDELTDKLVALNGEIVKLNSDLVGIDELRKRKLSLSTEKDEILQKSQITETRISTLESEQLILDELIDTFDDEELESSVTKLRILTNQLEKCTTERDKYQIKYDALVDKKSHLDSHKYNPDCDICMENSTTILSSKELVTVELNEMKTLLDSCIVKHTKLSESIESLSTAKSGWDTLQEAHQSESVIDRELTTLIGHLSTYELDEVKLTTQIEQQDELILEYHTNETQIEKNNIIRDEIKVIEDDLKLKRKSIQHFNTKLLTLTGVVSTLTSKKQSIEDSINEVKALEEQTRLYDFYLNAVNKDGISYELIKKALPMIEGEVNNILNQIVEFGIQLEVDGRNINATLVYGENKWPLEMCGGMERFISGLAIRVALINVCNLPRPNFLVIDEGFGTLDNENLQSLFLLFNYLKTQFDFVMIISHIDSMRDVVDNLIEIKKVDGFSHVKY